MTALQAIDLARVEAILASIPDPEIPVVNIRELGILREVRHIGEGVDEKVEVVITPTYSGCPAIGQMEDDIRTSLAREHIKATVTVQLSPAWTTDWITAAARDKLRAYGIAPPHSAGSANRAAGELAREPAGDLRAIQFAPKKVTVYAYSAVISGLFDSQKAVNCPQCNSANTTETSHFGSTACKALYRCLDCLEPFDYFKPY